MFSCIVVYIACVSNTVFLCGLFLGMPFLSGVTQGSANVHEPVCFSGGILCLSCRGSSGASSVAPAHAPSSCSIVSMWPDLLFFFFFATWKSLPVWMSRDLFHYVLATSPVFLHIPFICDFFLLFVACAIVLWQQPTFKLGAAELLQGSATMLLQLTSGRHERRYWPATLCN